jgi:hypothetical protein
VPRSGPVLCKIGQRDALSTLGVSGPPVTFFGSSLIGSLRTNLKAYHVENAETH